MVELRKKAIISKSTWLNIGKEDKQKQVDLFSPEKIITSFHYEGVNVSCKHIFMCVQLCVFVWGGVIEEVWKLHQDQNWLWLTFLRVTW